MLIGTGFVYQSIKCPEADLPHMPRGGTTVTLDQPEADFPGQQRAFCIWCGQSVYCTEKLADESFRPGLAELLDHRYWLAKPLSQVITEEP